MRTQEIMTTFPAPSRFRTQPEARPDRAEKAVVIMVTTPIASIGRDQSRRIEGQATPSEESGSPRLMKAA